MAALDNLLASGSPNVDDVTVCLQCQIRLASKADTADLCRIMKESKAASRVLAWYWASDSQSRKMIVGSRTLQAHLMKFVAAQGLQHLVADWLLALLKENDAGDWITDPSGWQTFGHMLVYFLLAEVNYGNGLGSAIEYYLRVCGELASAPSPSAKQLRTAGRNLSQWIIENAQDRTKKIPATTFDNYIRVTFAATPKSLPSVAMPIYHPNRPDVRRFVKFTRALPVETYRSWKQKKKDAFQRISIDAMRTLLGREESQQAILLAQSVLTLEERLDEASSGTTTASTTTTPMHEEDLLGRLSSALG